MSISSQCHVEVPLLYSGDFLILHSYVYNIYFFIGMYFYPSLVLDDKYHYFNYFFFFSFFFSFFNLTGPG